MIKPIMIQINQLLQS